MYNGTRIDTSILGTLCFLACCLAGEVLWMGQNIWLHLLLLFLVGLIASWKKLDLWPSWSWAALGLGLFPYMVVFTFKMDVQFPVPTDAFLEIYFPDLVMKNWHVAGSAGAAMCYVHYAAWSHYQKWTKDAPPFRHAVTSWAHPQTPGGAPFLAHSAGV